MNKELIKQYKAEFNHWLDGGTLLARRWVIDGNDGDTTYTIWYRVDSEGWEANKIFNTFIEYDRTQFVINDEYVEFRKVLAEGKTIEKNYGSMGFGCPNKWDDFSTKFGVKFEYGVECYRIKPDEPKFKVGDWVENITCSGPRIIKQVVNAPEGHDTVTVGNVDVGINVVLITDIKLWKPQPGEWCWFGLTYQWNPIADYTFGRLLAIESDGTYTFEPIHCELEDCSGYDFCEPFRGTLPSFLTKW